MSIILHMLEKAREFLIGAVPLVFVYFSGIVYIQNYLGEFNIYFNEVELGVNDVLVYAFITFSQPLFVIIISLVLIFLYWLHDNKNIYKNKIFDLTYIFSVIVIFLATIGSAKQAAHFRASEIWEGRGAALSPLAKLDDLGRTMNSLAVDDLKKCFSRNVGIIFSDKKNVYGLCRPVIQPSKAGRVIKLAEDGTIKLSWTVRN
jgi:hypothetical protein